ncbi:hypothetical protein C2E23DRAFT_724964, partial [Lenzites betulinus]
SERNNLLEHYVPSSDTLCAHLEETRAVIGGFAALSFLLRDSSMRPPTLEIYVASPHANHLIQLLEDDIEMDLDIQHVLNRRSHSASLPCHVRRATTFLTTRGRSITIYTSVSDSALDPIAARQCSALINWISPFIFACAYPTLTFQRRSLARAPSKTPLDISSQSDYTSLLRHGFDIRAEPSAWREYERRAYTSQHTWRQPCVRDLFLCPEQGRYFGDPGSLVTMFDLTAMDVDNLRRRREHPYAISVAWRLPSSRRPCASACGTYDPILPEGLRTFPVILVENTLRLRTVYLSYPSM